MTGLFIFLGILLAIVLLSVGIMSLTEEENYFISPKIRANYLFNRYVIKKRKKGYIILGQIWKFNFKIPYGSNGYSNLYYINHKARAEEILEEHINNLIDKKINNQKDRQYEHVVYTNEILLRKEMEDVKFYLKQLEEEQREFNKEIKPKLNEESSSKPRKPQLAQNTKQRIH